MVCFSWPLTRVKMNTMLYPMILRASFSPSLLPSFPPYTEHEWLQLNEKAILTAEGPMDIMKAVQSAPEIVNGSSTLMKMAFDSRVIGNLQTEQIALLRDYHAQAVDEELAATEALREEMRRDREQDEADAAAAAAAAEGEAADAPGTNGGASDGSSVVESDGVDDDGGQQGSAARGDSSGDDANKAGLVHDTPPPLPPRSPPRGQQGPPPLPNRRGVGGPPVEHSNRLARLSRADRGSSSSASEEGGGREGHRRVDSTKMWLEKPAPWSFSSRRLGEGRSSRRHSSVDSGGASGEDAEGEVAAPPPPPPPAEDDGDDGWGTDSEEEDSIRRSDATYFGRGNSSDTTGSSEDVSAARQLSGSGPGRRLVSASSSRSSARGLSTVEEAAGGSGGGGGIRAAGGQEPALQKRASWQRTVDPRYIRRFRSLSTFLRKSNTSFNQQYSTLQYRKGGGQTLSAKAPPIPSKLRPRHARTGSRSAPMRNGSREESGEANAGKGGSERAPPVPPLDGAAVRQFSNTVRVDNPLSGRLQALRQARAARQDPEASPSSTVSSGAPSPTSIPRWKAPPPVPSRSRTNRP